MEHAYRGGPRPRASATWRGHFVGRPRIFLVLDAHSDLLTYTRDSLQHSVNLLSRCRKLHEVYYNKYSSNPTSTRRWGSTRTM